MAKEELQYDDFLADVHADFQGFVSQVNDYCTQKGCKLKLELAKNGYVASYQFGKPGKTVLNFVFRKDKLFVRIYGDHTQRYLDYLETLPDSLVNAIDKAASCKRMLDPTKCNSRCAMGNDITIKGVRYQKCRYSTFLFEVTDENVPFLMGILQREIDERAA